MSMRARRSTSTTSPASSAVRGNTAPPTPKAVAPAARKAVALEASTPPVGTSAGLPRGPRMALTNSGPPNSRAGNSFTSPAPLFAARHTSVGVAAPGTETTPVLEAATTSSGSRWGETMNRAPASTACWTSSTERTVPAPTDIFGWFSVRVRMASNGRMESSVTSRAVRPATSAAVAMSSTYCKGHPRRIPITGIRAREAWRSVTGEG